MFPVIGNGLADNEAPAAALLLYVGAFYTVLPLAHSISAGGKTV
jgi:hypothetical protein